MQGFAQPTGPTALGASPGVPQVPGPAMPGGVAPNLTQYPAAPYTGYAPQGFPPPPQSGTYPGYFRVPGPSALGPAPGAPGDQTAVGGVGGVSMAPISTVAPPAGPGGPHPLPGMPQVPLPQGFPNPFSLQQVTQAPPPQQQAPPGQTTVTGPMGYHPGLGFFTPPSGQGAGAPPPTAFPVLPGGMPFPAQQTQPAQQAPPPAPPQGQAQQTPNPFWLQLAWQLAQTPAVQQALGDSAQLLLESEDRMRTLQIAAGCLAGNELQAAFKALTSGQLEQTRFTELFAQSVRQALGRAGLI
ncbi:MAG TPA: hypothetical protein VNT01_16840 [Symbiobacteriaceae bacterium]|nr:hypothetical protein [Symbiobacteriaceae bacterium]